MKQNKKQKEKTKNKTKLKKIKKKIKQTNKKIQSAFAVFYGTERSRHRAQAPSIIIHSTEVALGHPQLSISVCGHQEERSGRKDAASQDHTPLYFIQSGRKKQTSSDKYTRIKKPVVFKTIRQHCSAAAQHSHGRAGSFSGKGPPRASTPHNLYSCLVSDPSIRSAPGRRRHG